MGGSGRVGTSTSSVILTPSGKKRAAARRRRQEKVWAAKCGAVVVKQTEPQE